MEDPSITPKIHDRLEIYDMQEEFAETRTQQLASAHHPVEMQSTMMR